MPLSRSLKQKTRTRGTGANAERAAGDAREDNGVDRKDGRARPDAAKGSPVEPLDTKARLIKSRD